MINFNILHLARTSSTNTFLKELSVKETLSEGTVIMTDCQTHGRGQGKNKWFSSKGKNLTFSILFTPKIPFIHHFSLAEFVSLAITDLLADYNITSSIKWPNDIYVDNKKIAGILIENVLTQDKISQTITGIGLNINENNFPADLPNPVSLRELTGETYLLESILEKLLNKIKLRYEYLQKGKIQELHGEYNSKLYRRGILSSFLKEDELFEATITEVKTSGELAVKLQNGESGFYLFGEIELIV